MKIVKKCGEVNLVIEIDGIETQLERLTENLRKIRKALSEFLERERASFPRWVLYLFPQRKKRAKSCSFRFYFVGDEDLVEIIGSSKNIPRLQKHFKKIFAGVDAIELDDEGTAVNVAATIIPSAIPEYFGQRGRSWIHASKCEKLRTQRSWLH